MTRKMQIAFIAAYAILILSASGCINLKDDYPDIVYYNLKQEPSTLAKTDTIPGALQIRDFTISAEYNNEQITANWEGGRNQRYYYHRWATDFSDLATDFFVKRFSIKNAFKGGVTKSVSISLPDYILEGQVIEIFTRNSDSKEPGKNYVKFGMKVTLFKRSTDKFEQTILLSKVYEQKENRLNSEIASVGDSFSKAISMIADQVLVDMQVAIMKDKIKN